MVNNIQYVLLAELFKYPAEDASEKVLECQEMLNSKYPEAGIILNRFSEYFLPLSQDLKEELYTKTFDVQPICYLDLGYVIFGEDYKRGTFLLHMKEEQRNLGRNCDPELPDNLYHVLHLLTVHPSVEFVNELVAKIIVPGVKKMLKEFDSARVELKIQVLKKLHNALIQEELNIGNVYQHTFRALLAVLEQDFSEAIDKFTPKEQDLVKNSFFAKNNTVNQVVK